MAQKVIFYFLLIPLFLLFLEALSLLALSIVYHKKSPLPEIRAQQFERIIMESKPLGMERIPDKAIHPYLGYVYNYQSNSELRTQAHSGFPISRFGFIDDKEPFQVRSPNKVILGITGGSVAYGLSALGHRHLIAELQKDPLFQGKEFVIVRLALGGFKQPQQLMTLNYLLSLGAQFDILLNVDGFNEVALSLLENVPKKTVSYFPHGWTFMFKSMLNNNFLYDETMLAWLQWARGQWADFFYRSPQRHSWTLGLIWKAGDLVLTSRISAKFKAIVTWEPDPNQELDYQATGPWWDDATEEDTYREIKNVWMRSSFLLHQLCEANGIRYFHFLQPNQYVAGSRKFTDEEARNAYNKNQLYKKYIEKGYPVMIEGGKELAAKGVHFHDLTRVFLHNPEPVYGDDCCHYVTPANEFLGTQIGQMILQDIHGRKSNLR